MNLGSLLLFKFLCFSALSGCYAIERECLLSEQDMQRKEILDNWVLDRQQNRKLGAIEQMLKEKGIWDETVVNDIRSVD